MSPLVCRFSDTGKDELTTRHADEMTPGLVASPMLPAITLKEPCGCAGSLSVELIKIVAPCLN